MSNYTNINTYYNMTLNIKDCLRKLVMFKFKLLNIKEKHIR